MNETTDVIDGYACPIDPFDAMMCDSCQQSEYKYPLNWGYLYDMLVPVASMED